MKKFVLSILSIIAVALTGYAVDAKVVFSELGYANATEVKTVAVDDNITLTFDKGTNSNTPKYYNSGTALRLYGGGTMTITAINGCTIESVVMNTGTGDYVINAESTVSTGTLTINGAVGTISDVNGPTTTLTQGGSKGHVRIEDITITYTEGGAVSSVADPTFSAEAGTYGADGEPLSLELACESEGASIYYTLDGTTPDNTSTLYEAAIELNTKTTVKAVAYVGEEASKVVSATYDFKLDCVLTWNENSPFIQANTSMPKTNFVSPLGNNGAKYWVTYDGTTPSAENGASKYPSVTFPMYTVKQDTIFTMKVRPEKNGIYGDVLEGTFYFAYAGALDVYLGITEMTAGNYVMSANNSLAHGIADNKTYDYLPTVAATVSNGCAYAYSYFEWTFEAAEGGYYIKDSKGRYIYMKGTYNNFNVSETVPTEGGVWSVEINADGTAKITNVEKQKYIQLSTQYGTWGSYANEQGTMPVLGAKYQPTVTVTPAENSTVDAISKITFTCPDGIQANGTKYMGVMLQGMNGVFAQVTAANQVDENTVEFILAEEVVDAGEYILPLSKELFIVAPNSVAMKYPSENIQITYNVTGNLAGSELVVTPESGVYKSLQDFTFTYKDGIALNAEFDALQTPALYENSMTAISLVSKVVNDTTIVLSTESEITTEGNMYTLMVPAGYFILGGLKESKQVVVEYMVSKFNPNAINIVNVNPAEGTVTELSKIVITTDTDLDVAPTTWTLTDANGTLYELNTTTNDEDDDDIYETVNVTLKTAITANGTYTLNIPAGSLNEYLGSKTIEATTLTWTIGSEEPGNGFDLAVDPAEGEVYKLTSKLYVFTDNEIVYQDAYDATKISLTDADGNNYLETFGAVDYDGDVKYDGLYIRTLNKEDITAAGTYTLTIEAGLITEKESGKVNNKATFTWTVNPNAEKPSINCVSISPAEGVVTEIPATINIYTDVDLDYDLKHELVSLTDDKGNSYAVTDIACEDENLDWVYERADIKLSSAITSPGTYTLTVQAGALKDYWSDKVNKEWSFTWTIEGGEPVASKELVITPAPGSTFDKLDEITFYCEAGLEAKLSTLKWSQLYTPDGKTVDLNNDNFVVVDDKTVKLVFSPSYIQAGTYELALTPNGFVVDPNDTKVSYPESNSQPLTFTLTGNGTADLTLTEAAPADGATLDEITEVVLTFNGAISTSENTPDNPYYLLDENGEQVDTWFVEGYKDLEPNQVRFTIGDVVTKGGEYTFVLAKGYFVDENGSANSEVRLTYTVTGNNYQEETTYLTMVSSNPEDCGTVSKLESFEVVWNEEVWTSGETADYEMAYMVDENDAYVCDVWASVSDKDATMAILKLDEPITAEGAYSLVIPEGLYEGESGAINEETWIMVTVGSAKEDIYVISSDPEANSSVAELKEVTVEFNIDVLSMNAPTVVDAEGNLLSNTTVSYLDADFGMLEANVLRFVLATPVTGECTATLVFNAGDLMGKDSGATNAEEIRISFNVTGQGGIEGITADPVNGYVVYNLSGYRVMQTRKASDLLRLENGFYIINGKKVVINK